MSMRSYHIYGLCFLSWVVVWAGTAKADRSARTEQLLSSIISVEMYDRTFAHCDEVAPDHTEANRALFDEFETRHKFDRTRALGDSLESEIKTKNVKSGQKFDVITEYIWEEIRQEIDVDPLVVCENGKNLLFLVEDNMRFITVMLLGKGLGTLRPNRVLSPENLDLLENHQVM